MNDVLFHLCRHYVSIMYGWVPMPSTVLCQTVGKSLYQTRKELKRLKEQGLVESVRHCNVTEDGNYLLSGWKITDKAKETPEYKKAYEEEREICLKAFDIDIGTAEQEFRRMQEIIEGVTEDGK